MNIKKLEAFISVLDKKSFSEAAAVLKSSQPAVSLKIKSLEEELGIELLDRGHSGIKPTAAGILVYQAAKEIMKRWERLGDDLHGFKDTLTGTLRIGASTIPGTYLVPAWIKKFRMLYPKVDVTIEISDSKKVSNKLLDNQIDVGILGLCQQSNKIYTRPIASDTLVLIVPVEESLSQSSELDFKLLKNYDFILREEGSGTRKAMEELLGLNRFSHADLRTSISIGSSEAVIAAVEAGLGISFVSKLAAEPAVKANRIKMIDTFKPCKRNFYFSTLSEAKNRPVINEFTDLLLKEVGPL